MAQRDQESRLHAPGRKAHHIGCSWIALMPLCLIRNATSCRRGKAAFSSPPGPDQKTSAEAAARGQTMESRFSGPDCSVHNSCWPGFDERESENELRVVGQQGERTAEHEVRL